MKKTSKIKVFALGGLGEVGKNMYIVEQNNEILIIDSGTIFPEDDYGVDSIIPDYSYLKENEEKIIGLFITHGHEDHIGGIPYLLKTVKIPKVYACGLALGLIRSKISQFANLPIHLEEYTSSSIYNFQNFQVSFFKTNHSIPDSHGIAIKTSLGYILHTGDFKFDFTPIGEHTEYAKLTQYSQSGVLLLLSDSTNAGVGKLAISESKISANISSIFSQIKGRILISTFASNVYRVQQIVEASVKHGRKVIIFGRSMEKTINVGQQLKYIKAPQGTFITVKEFPFLDPSKITILSTGSQGEPLAALSRIAEGTHRQIKIIPGDTIVFSSSAIPGNQESINRTINKLYKAGANVIVNSPLSDTHTSGHASANELQLMLVLTKPKYFIPIHGEYAMQKRHVDLACATKMARNNCYILENGEVLELTENGASKKGSVVSGNIFIDSNNTVIDGTVIKERKLLSDDGLLVLTYLIKNNKLVRKPEVMSRGFIYMKSSEELISQIQDCAEATCLNYLINNNTFIAHNFKKEVYSVVSNLIYSLTERKPILIPVIMEINDLKKV